MSIIQTKIHCLNSTYIVSHCW